MCCVEIPAPVQDYRLRFETQGNTLRVELEGATVSPQSRLACWTGVAEEVARCGAAAVLAIDRRQGTLATTREWRALLRQLDTATLKAMPLAYVGSWPRFTQMETLNLLLIERGFHAQVFDEVGAAERWLRYGEHGRSVRPLDHFSTKARSNT
ncbi:MAG TPA: hypothetical protein VM687_10950 [Stenotrophomonas sp.]|nr:hypothetical protein [Stenotrophomonas sp.]